MRLERVKDRDIGVLHAQGIVGVDVITRTCIAWSSAAGSPPTAPAGSLAGLASSRLSLPVSSDLEQLFAGHRSRLRKLPAS
jgi:hypothetical protein